MITVFIILQLILFLFMLLHDWVPVPPLNDVAALKRVDSHFHRILGSLINGLVVLIPMVITLTYYHQANIPLAAATNMFAFYFCLLIGAILSWWA